MNCLELIFTKNQRLKDHCLIGIKKSEDHVKVYKRFGRFGQLLYNYVLLLGTPRSAKTVYEHINTLTASPCAISNKQNILPCYQNIPSLHINLVITGLKIVRIQYITIKNSLAPEYGFTNKRLPHPYLACHLANQHLIPY